MLKLLFCFAAVLFLNSVPNSCLALESADPDGLQRHTISVGGLTRTFYLYPVAGDNLPLVFVLHGLGGDAPQALRDYGWITKAATEHFIVVGLEALPADCSKPVSKRNSRFWNTGNPEIKGATTTYDDVQYARSTLEDIQKHYSIDPGKVFACGFSSGAGMTHRLGVEMSDKLAAIAPVASQLFVEKELAQPLSVLMIFGKADPIVPFMGGERRLPGGKSPLFRRRRKQCLNG